MSVELLFVYPNQFGYHTDSYKYCQYLNSKYQISYVCIDQGLVPMALPNVNVIYLPLGRNRVLRLFRFISLAVRTTRKRDYMILFTIQFKLCFLIGLFGRAQKKILDYRTGDLSPGRMIRWLRNRFMQFDAFFYNHASVVSEGLRDLIYLNRSRTTILPLGADIISSKQHSYQRLHLLYVGAIHHRNVYQTIEGIGILVNENAQLREQVNYTIVGFGPREAIDHLLRTIDRLKLQDIVHFEGRKMYTELAGYFDQCNIGIAYIPIRPYYEFQPATKTCEYLLSGLFTIATKTHENQKVITKSNGVLCHDTPESFARAVQDTYESRFSISEAQIRDSIKEYHWNTIVKSILEPMLDN